jgi:hypothetical protein
MVQWRCYHCLQIHAVCSFVFFLRPKTRPNREPTLRQLEASAHDDDFLLLFQFPFMHSAGFNVTADCLPTASPQQSKLV